MCTSCVVLLTNIPSKLNYTAIPFLGGKGKSDPFKVDGNNQQRMKRMVKRGKVSEWDVTILTEILNNCNHPFLVDRHSEAISQLKSDVINATRECRNDFAHPKKGAKRNIVELRKIVDSLMSVCDLLLDVSDREKLVEDLAALSNKAREMSGDKLKEYYNKTKELMEQLEVRLCEMIREVVKDEVSSAVYDPEVLKVYNTNVSIKTSFNAVIRECMTTFIGREWLPPHIQKLFTNILNRSVVVLGDPGIGECDQFNN